MLWNRPKSKPGTPLISRHFHQAPHYGTSGATTPSSRRDDSGHPTRGCIFRAPVAWFLNSMSTLSSSSVAGELRGRRSCAPPGAARPQRTSRTHTLSLSLSHTTTLTQTLSLTHSITHTHTHSVTDSLPRTRGGCVERIHLRTQGYEDAVGRFTHDSYVHPL